MIKVKFFTLLRLYLDLEEVDIDPGADEIDVRTLLEKVCEAVGGELVREKLLEPDGSMKTGTIILINGGDVMDSDKLDCTVKSGDSVSLFPPGGGG
jgi:molybdopterin converting factor small subunit